MDWGECPYVNETPICNPSYMGGIGLGDSGWRPTPDKNARPYLKKINSKN
jgi:hypothetical protein